MQYLISFKILKIINSIDNNDQLIEHYNIIMNNISSLHNQDNIHTILSYKKYSCVLIYIYLIFFILVIAKTVSDSTIMECVYFITVISNNMFFLHIVESTKYNKFFSIKINEFGYDIDETFKLYDMYFHEDEEKNII